MYFGHLGKRQRRILQRHFAQAGRNENELDFFFSVVN